MMISARISLVRTIQRSCCRLPVHDGVDYGSRMLSSAIRKSLSVPISHILRTSTVDTAGTAQIRSISRSTPIIRCLNTSSQNITDKVQQHTDQVGGNDQQAISSATGSSGSNSIPVIVPRTTRRSSFSTNGQNHHRHHRSTNTMMNQFILQQFKPEAIVPVRAIHAAQTIDLNILFSSAFQQNATKKQMFGKNSIVIRLADNITIPTSTNPTTTTKNGKNTAATSTTVNTNNYNDTGTVDPTLSTWSRTSKLTPRYMAVFRFGSIVYFNVEEDIAKQLTCSIKKIAAFGPVPAGMERKENFGVLVTRDMDFTSNNAMISSLLVNDPHGNNLDAHGHPNHDTNTNNSSGNESLLLEPVTGDYCMVPELDMNGVAVIGTIMGQTVTLDSYSDTVEELLTNFARINSTVTQTGSFTSGDKSFLFKTVAQNNSIFIDMISKVRIKDRSDTAWNLTKYETIHYGLKEEFVRVLRFYVKLACLLTVLLFVSSTSFGFFSLFYRSTNQTQELDDRFENIEFKLNLIHNNAKFFLEVMHHQKANNLEWIIVVLILAECILMCIEMSGFGESFFRFLFGFVPFYPSASPAVQIVSTTPAIVNGELHIMDDDVNNK